MPAYPPDQQPPEDFLQSIREGFPAPERDDVREWLNEKMPEDWREAINDGLVTIDWATLAVDAGLATPDEWEHVTWHHYADGTESIEVTTRDGETIEIGRDADPEYIHDLWWDDLYDLIAEYEIDFERDYEEAS